MGKKSIISQEEENLNNENLEEKNTTSEFTEIIKEEEERIGFASLKYDLSLKDLAQYSSSLSQILKDNDAMTSVRLDKKTASKLDLFLAATKFKKKIVIEYALTCFLEKNPEVIAKMVQDLTGMTK